MIKFTHTLIILVDFRALTHVACEYIKCLEKAVEFYMLVGCFKVCDS